MAGRFVLLFSFLFFYCVSFSQSWHWAKKQLIIEGIPTLPVKSCIDSRGNTILLSLKLDRQILSKHDVNGNLLWKRELFLVTQNSSNLTDICLDGLDNIYLMMAAVSRIDAVAINTPNYSLIKLNSEGRFSWFKKIEYTPLIFAPRIIYSGNSLYLALGIRQFQSLTYQSVVYNNIGGNTDCSWIAALDTSGNVQWTKRLYSPPQPISCNVSNVYPEISVNPDKDLLLVGAATNKLMVETTAVIDYPHTCKQFTYGMVLNGNNGQVKWAKELSLDTLVPSTNHSIILRRTLSTILSNGYSVVYRYITKDTALTTPYQRIINLSNNIYLFDKAGNMIRKDSFSVVDTGYHEMLQLKAGDAVNFYSSGLYHDVSPGIYIGHAKYEARKWDTLLAPVWKKNTVYSRNSPYFSSSNLYYRNNQLSIMLQSGSESNQATYAYFGADSLMPYLDHLYARIVDSSNYISGQIFFDLNKNNIKDNGEPNAPGILLGSITGNTIYTSTRANGFYEMKANPGTYNLKPLNVAATYPNYTVVTPSNHSVTLPGYGDYILNKNFGLQPNTAVTDGQINFTPYGIARPGGTIVYRVLIKNTGAIGFTGSYMIRFDTSRLIYQGSKQTPSNIGMPALTYSVSNLNPLDSTSNDIEFRVKTSAKVNDTVQLKAELTVAADALAVNNTDSTFTIIRGSFDPNMKEVYPFKDLRYDSVIAGKQELDYRIHFQNTGNDTAFTVLVIDTLDSKFDLSSFRLISSSHPVTINYEGSNVIGFYFSNILLPDSNTNEIKSHGFVRFAIKPKTNIQLYDLVHNNASIYFDYNSPIKTNTVTSNFIHSVVTAINNNNIQVRGIRMQPNPARTNIYFKVTTANITENMVLNMYDHSGRLVMNTLKQIVSNQEQMLDVSRLSSGIYYLELKGKKNRFVEKIVLQ